ncbi:alpha-amylase family glycosyl hydrolase [Calditrichota bacterium LG25]
MRLNYRKIFAEVEPGIREFAFQREFVDLGRETGPANPEWIKGRAIYEIYVRAFSEEGSFKAVQAALPELKQYGIDVIWFMPIFPIGEKERKGPLGCPYSIKDYFTVNPEYGTEQDFKNLIENAHRLGMKVLIDMVPNHVAHDYRYLKTIPELIRYDENGKPLRKVADWTDVVDVDYSRPATREHMAEVMKHWITEYDVDGYRCDVAGLVPMDFWEWAAPQLRALKEDFYLLAEWESQLLHQKVFNSTYDWSTLQILKDVFEKKVSVQRLAEWLLTKAAIYPQNALPLRFLENHDLPRAAAEFSEEQVLCGLLFIFSLHGVPLIYNGQEIGARQTPSLFEKQTIEWQDKNEKMYAFLQSLLRLRKEKAALSSKEYVFKSAYFKDGILSFEKEDLWIIINFSDVQREIAAEDGELLLNTHHKLRRHAGRWQLQPCQGILLRKQ